MFLFSEKFSFPSRKPFAFENRSFFSGRFFFQSLLFSLGFPQSIVNFSSKITFLPIFPTKDNWHFDHTISSSQRYINIPLKNERYVLWFWQVKWLSLETKSSFHWTLLGKETSCIYTSLVNNMSDMMAILLAMVVHVKEQIPQKVNVP